MIVSSKGFLCKNGDCDFRLWENDLFFSSRKKEITKTIASALLNLKKLL